MAEEEGDVASAPKFTAAEYAAGHADALSKCVSGLSPLEKVLSKNPWCCGATMGVADASACLTWFNASGYVN